MGRTGWGIGVAARPLIIGHRGHSADAPEQTMAAFGEAITRGADMIEADVRRTRDGILVLLHDETLDRTTSGTGPLAEVTYAEIQRVDAGSWFSPEFAGERIPTLDELFDLAAAAGTALCLEVKGTTAAERREVSISVANEIAVRGRLHGDVLASFDHDALSAAAAAIPGIRLAPDRLPERGPSSAAEILDQVQRCGARIIQHHHRDLRPAVVEALHTAGVDVWAWPPTTAGEIGRALAMGVDGLMGDDVSAAVACVARV